MATVSYGKIAAQWAREKDDPDYPRTRRDTRERTTEEKDGRGRKGRRGSDGPLTRNTNYSQALQSQSKYETIG